MYPIHVPPTKYIDTRLAMCYNTRITQTLGAQNHFMAKSEYREMTTAWIAEPESIEHLCDAISEGATLSEYCRDNTLKYRMVLAYVEEDEARKAAYDIAVKARTMNLEDKVLTSLRNAASIDPRTLFDNRGNLVPVTDLPDHIAASLTEVSALADKDGDVTTKIKFTPRHTANQDLGKHLGMFRDRLDVTTNGKDVKEISDNDAARRVAFLLNKAVNSQDKEAQNG